jgi:hypothetical protein
MRAYTIAPTYSEQEESVRVMFSPFVEDTARTTSVAHTKAKYRIFSAPDQIAGSSLPDIGPIYKPKADRTKISIFPKTAQATFTQVNEVKSLIEKLKSLGVAVPVEKEVGRYLSKHKDMVNVIRDITTSAQKKFKGSTLALKLFKEPEINDEYLALYVSPKEYGEQTQNLLDEILDNFSEQISNKSGWISILTSFENA